MHPCVRPLASYRQHADDPGRALSFGQGSSLLQTYNSGTPHRLPLVRALLVDRLGQYQQPLARQRAGQCIAGRMPCALSQQIHPNAGLKAQQPIAPRLTSL